MEIHLVRATLSLKRSTVMFNRALGVALTRLIRVCNVNLHVMSVVSLSSFKHLEAHIFVVEPKVALGGEQAQDLAHLLEGFRSLRTSASILGVLCERTAFNSRHGVGNLCVKKDAVKRVLAGRLMLVEKLEFITFAVGVLSAGSI